MARWLRGTDRSTAGACRFACSTRIDLPRFSISRAGQKHIGYDAGSDTARGSVTPVFAAVASAAMAFPAVWDCALRSTAAWNSAAGRRTAAMAVVAAPPAAVEEVIAEIRVGVIRCSVEIVGQYAAVRRIVIVARRTRIRVLRASRRRHHRSGNRNSKAEQ